MPNKQKTDVIVVGAGAAGLLTALKLAPLRVTIIAKSPMGTGASSTWAQGGIAAAMARDNSPSSHALDTLATASGLGIEEIITLLTEEGPRRITELIDLGMTFDVDADGSLALGREAAHSHRRILHAQGDATGKELMRVLIASVQSAPHISVVSDISGHSLIVDDGRIFGIHAGSSNGSMTITAAAVVLATGGIGSLYHHTTNPLESCGDGVAIAARVGAKIADPEFVQFHPTAIDVGVSPMPLATEALRGEGALLINSAEIRFMPAIHCDGELAPRDVVARAIWYQQQKGQKVFLDCRQAIGVTFAKRYPTVYGHCREHGIDPHRHPIPIAPAAHYHMGGIQVDINGRSSVPGLWACGEVAAAGIHGANRLASNSLLELIVFAPRVAAEILSTCLVYPDRAYEGDYSAPLKTNANEERINTRLRRLAYDTLGLVRDGQSLRATVRKILNLENFTTGRSVALTNRLTILKLIAVTALNRNESRGGHFRADHPQTRDSFARRTLTTLTEVNEQAAAISAGDYH